MSSRKLRFILILICVASGAYCGQAQAQSLPSGWTDGDIGTVGHAGSASYSNNAFTVQAAGSGFFSTTADSFHFVYQSLSGDGAIVARIVSTNYSYTQFGLMIRETLNANATSMLVMDYGGYIYGAYRTTTGATSGDTNYHVEAPLPFWLELVRSGNTFTPYVSTDGVNWVQAGTSETISMAQDVYIGLALSSGSTSTVYDSVFDSVSINSSASAAPEITSVSATTGSVGSQVSISGSGFGSTQSSSEVLLNGASTTINSWSDTAISMTVPSGAATGYLLVVVAPSMNCSNPVEFAVTTTPLPAGWLDQDVGPVALTQSGSYLIGADGLAGSATYASGAFAVKAAGSTFYSATADAFHFVYQPLSGDGTIVARIVSTNYSYTQFGLMIRETLNANATSMLVMDTGGSLNGVYRTTTGAANGHTNYEYSASLPYWLMLERSGSTFTAYAAPDGINWVQLGTSETINMAQDVYIGLALSSTSTSTLYTSAFDGVSVNSTASPAPEISSVSATTVTIGSQVTLYGSGFGTTQGSSEVLLNGASATVSSWSNTSISITIPSGASTGYLLVAVAPSMNCTNPVEFTVTTNPLPTDWLDQDIGEVGLRGSATYTNGAFTVQGAGGTSIGRAVDALHFVYQPLSGDGTIVARVVSSNYPYTYGQMGVMFRETLEADAQEIFVFATYGGEAEGLYRTVPDQTAQETPAVSAPLPYWVKLVRSGNNFVGYISPDGVSWTIVVGPLPIDMAQSSYVGFAVSGSTTTLNTTAFDSVSISTTANPNPVITGVSATSVSVGSQVTISGSGFGASQGTSAVFLNDAPVTINSWSATSISITIPTGATSGLLVVLVGPSMTSSNGVAITVTSQPLPSTWLDQDIGPVGKAGNASYASGVFTVKGAGDYVANSVDAFHFVYQPLTSDGSIVARVVSQSTSSEAGVMIRETLDPSSAELFSYIYAFSSSHSAYMNYRTIEGGTASSGGGGTVTLPYWVEVTRTGNTFSCYVSPDGSTWSQAGTTQTISTALQVLVGLGVSSGSTSTLATATFDNVSDTQGGSLANPIITSLSPTSGAPESAVTI
ncbi:MAG: IPT/TIG domain-containing protein, partial [Candidatus Acidiferrales bacterium]